MLFAQMLILILCTQDGHPERILIFPTENLQASPLYRDERLTSISYLSELAKKTKHQHQLTYE